MTWVDELFRFIREFLPCGGRKGNIQINRDVCLLRAGNHFKSFVIPSECNQSQHINNRYLNAVNLPKDHLLNILQNIWTEKYQAVHV